MREFWRDVNQYGASLAGVNGSQVNSNAPGGVPSGISTEPSQQRLNNIPKPN